MSQKKERTPNQIARSRADYKRNRAKLLADSPPCHWCGVRQATEADHLLEVDLVGLNDPNLNALERLVPSCKPCNSRRGQAYRTRKERDKNGTLVAGNTPATNPTTESGHDRGQQRPDFFISSSSLPPRDLFRISETTQSGYETKTIGHETPRLETTTPNWALDRVGEIAEYAREALGVELMPWQLHVLRGMTAYYPPEAGDRAGDYLRRVALTSVARQNGKTTLIGAIIGHFLEVEAPRRGFPQTVLSTSHKLDLSTSLFRYLAPILEKRLRAKVSWSYGRNYLETPDGHTWLVRAATPAAGHGYSLDLVIADEVFDISEDAIDHGLLPTQRARKNPLFLMFSTAGTEASKAMLRWREQGLKQIDDNAYGPMYFAEYSPPPGLDPLTVEAWRYGNPALGHLLPVEVLQSEAKSPNRNAFLRASVNLWTAEQNAWLEPGVWDACKTDHPPAPGGWLAIEASIDEASYVAIRANVSDRVVYVTTAFIADSTAELWRLVQKEVDENPGLKIAIPPSLEIGLPPILERRRTIVGYRELLKWTLTVRSLIIENRLRHTGDLLLSTHVERAVMVKHQGSVAISSTRSPGPVEACRAMVWAAALASRPEAGGKPMLVIAR